MDNITVPIGAGREVITLDETPTYDTYWYYDLSNITTDHIINVTTSGGETSTIYVKVNGAWVEAVPYKKINGSWVQQTDVTTVFNSSTHYVKGN